MLILTQIRASYLLVLEIIDSTCSNENISFVLKRKFCRYLLQLVAATSHIFVKHNYFPADYKKKKKFHFSNSKPYNYFKNS